MNVVDIRKPSGGNPRIVSALIAISKKTRAILGLRLADIGLLVGEDDIVVALEEGRTRSISELSKALFVRFPTMQKAVDALVARGLLESTGGPLVSLTAKGKDMLPRIASVRSGISADLIAVLGVDRMDRLAAELEALDRGLGRPMAPAA